jgi:hypothetical protein
MVLRELRELLKVGFALFEEGVFSFLGFFGEVV